MEKNVMGQLYTGLLQLSKKIDGNTWQIQWCGKDHLVI